MAKLSENRYMHEHAGSIEEGRRGQDSCCAWESLRANSLGTSFLLKSEEFGRGSNDWPESDPIQGVQKLFCIVGQVECWRFW